MQDYSQLERFGVHYCHPTPVLLHLKEWEVVLKKLADSLKPGGWLFIEDPDLDGMMCDAATEYVDRAIIGRHFDAVKQMMSKFGMDMNFGSNTLKAFKDNELESLKSESSSQVVFGGSQMAELFRPSVEMKDRLVFALDWLRVKMSMNSQNVHVNQPSFSGVLGRCPLWAEGLPNSKIKLRYSVMDSDKNPATMATIIKDSFTHRIQSTHVDGMEYLINVHLPLTYGMNEDSYPVIYYTDAFFATEIVTGIKKILEVSGKIANTILVGISHEGDLMRFVVFVPEI